MCGIYLHIPFCKQACSYCDFYFVTRQQLIPAFVNALIAEIRRFSEHPMAAEPVKSIYFGGGTPSLLSASHLERIFRALDDTFDLEPEEVTIEMNPDDTEASKLRAWQSLGINRVSMGIQSFDDNLLHTMHRAHTRNEAITALELLAHTGFHRFTADLIYGNPGQSEDMLNADLEQLLAFSPPHISAYALMIEEGTRLGKQVALGRTEVPDDEQVIRHVHRVQERLTEAGYSRYEVSNFAQPGCEALHNTNYWKHVNYVGFGPSAHSFWWSGTGNKAVRWENVRDLGAYLKPFTGDAFTVSDGLMVPGTTRLTTSEQLDLHTLAEERITLGLRMRTGIAEQELRDRYAYTINPKQREWIKLQEAAGTFQAGDGTLSLTPEGLSIADYLTVKLLSLT